MSNRRPNTKCNGKDFSKEEELQVWNKAKIISGENSDKIREDKCGATIYFEKYGDRGSKHGWEIDHIVPADDCGGDELSNLQPLHWANNLLKSNKSDKTHPAYCKITS